MSNIIRKAIKCKNIYTNSTKNPISGYLLIHNEKIHEIIPQSEMKNEFLLQYDLKILDDDFYIFPGIIDSNVNLNSTYDYNWQDFTNITKMAAQGGVTTIIDNPLLNNYFMENSNNKEDNFQKIDSSISTILINF